MTKSMGVDNRGRRKSLRTKEECFEANLENGILVVRTLHGFWYKAMYWCMENRLTFELRDLRVKDMLPPPRFDLMCNFRFRQRELLEKALLKNCSGLIGAPTRYGKCFGKFTGILMYDGSVKFVQDIVEGDLVMGHDSKPRKVTGCVTGKDLMYRIIPNKGEPFEVTQDHKLVLWRTSQGTRLTQRKTKGGMTRSPNLDHQEIIITPAEYEIKSNTFKHLHKLISRPAIFPAVEVRVDPYCYGLWIGDGTTGKPALTTADSVCRSAWLDEADKHRIAIRTTNKRNNKASTYHMSNAWKNYAWLQVSKDSSISGHKRLLPEFKINSREIRLQVLAGVIDSDGYTNSDKTYAVIGKYKDLIEDIQFLCRSLGFRATMYSKLRKAHAGHEAEYYELHISGPVHEVPVRLERKKLPAPTGKINHLVTGFTMQRLEMGEYFGFEVEGEDKKFLMGNFMVTHNSTLMRNILRAWPTTQTIVILPGADLLRQCHEELKAEIPDREIKLIGAGSKTQYQSEDITVVSMDSLHKVDPGPVKLMVIDEPHAVVASSRINYLPLFTNARRYGLGATLNGRYDGRDFLLEGHVGPVLAKRTYTEGVAEGAICPIKVMMIRWPIANISGDRDNAYRTQLFENELIGRCARYLSDVVIPRDWQMLYFIKTESQADFLSDCIGRDVSVAMAKKLSDKERKAMTERVRKNHIKRVICSDIYVQGVTFHEVMVLVNCGGGGASTSTIQKPGRLAEIRKGKSAGLMIDFLFTTQNEGMPNCDAEALSPGKMRGMSEGVGCLVRESYLRLKAYHDIGYDVDIVERKNMHDWFLKQNITPPD